MLRVQKLSRKHMLFALFVGLFTVSLSMVALPSIARADCGPIILDPGHGGSETGAIGVNGLKEKDLTFKIANYCKERLDQLGIPSVMTRTGDYDVSLASRCNFIDQYNGRALVSFHLNSNSGTPATGAEVWVPHDSSYMQFTYSETSSFGNNVLKRFQNLGLLNRGIKTRTIDSAYYPDGSNQDYLAINRLSRQKGTSGVLIEHAFINNVDDAARLSDETFLRELGYSDAEAIAEQWPNSYVKPGEDDWSPGWKHDEHGWWFRNEDGSFLTNGWYWIGSAWYHFDASGYMNTGWFWDNGWCWLGDQNDGSMHKGGWNWCNWAWYWLEDNGIAKGEGWFWNNNTWYWLNSGGDMSIGWRWIWNNWYYFNEFGTMQTHWFLDGMTWSYADGSGAVWHNGWAFISGGWYFLHSNCSMHTGWLSDHYWYFMDSKGGWMCHGWVWANDSYYYLDEAGHMQNGWLWDGSNWYWLGTGGNMAFHGPAYTSSGFNLFDDSGHWITEDGWHLVDNRWYLLSAWNVLTGWQWVGNAWYYMYNSGEMAKGPVDVDGQKYFCDKNSGAMLRNCWVTADGDRCDPSDPARMYYLNDAGHIVSADETPVMGESTLPYNTFINNFAAKIALNYPSVYAEKGAATSQDFAAATWTEAYAEGVNPVVLAAQIGVETGWLKFGGTVPDWACNFGGLGAVDSAPQSYCIFDSVQQGLLAQVQHLKAYASTAPLNQPCVDPRFKYVTRGIAPYVQQYGNGVWASDSNYAKKLINAMAVLS